MFVLYSDHTKRMGEESGRGLGKFINTERSRAAWDEPGGGK